jgi:branched-chain amino acid transport system permease protein
VSGLDVKTTVERVLGVVLLLVAALGPQLFNAYWLDVILTQALLLGIAAASLIFLSAYGGMVSLAQTALMGIAGYMLGNMVTRSGPGGESKGLLLGLDPSLALVLAIAITVVIGLVFGALASRSFGIYFLMLTLTLAVIANLFFGSVTQLGGFSPIAGVNQYTPAFVGDIATDRERLYYIALVVSVFVYLLLRYITRTPFGIAFAGIRDEPVRMASLGYAVPLPDARIRLAAFIASLAGSSMLVERPDRTAGLGLGPTIDLLIIAVIGGLSRIEVPGSRLHVHRHQQLRRQLGPDRRLARGRRPVQHGHRAHLPRHRDRLARRADRAVGPYLGRGAPPWRAATGRSGDSRGGDGNELFVRGWNREATCRRLTSELVDSLEVQASRRRKDESKLVEAPASARSARDCCHGPRLVVGRGAKGERGSRRDHDRLQGRLRRELRE